MHDYDKLLSTVITPGQYVGGEVNRTIKPHAKYKFALAFPDVYHVAMSNHGLRILYEIISQRENWQAERVFAPLPDMEAQLRHAEIIIPTLDTQTPLNQCDVIGFSLSCELHSTGMLTILSLGKIPLLANERDEKCPLIFAGGHSVFNPAPMADFVDIFVIGDGEEVLVEIMNAVEIFSSSISRAEKIKYLIDNIEGLYCPQFSPPDKKIKRRVVKNFAEITPSLKPIVPIVETAHERIVLEIMRGCPNGCRFCQAGFISRPFRYRSAENLLAQAREIYQCTGYDEIGLLSLSSSDYPELEKLAELLDAEFADKSVNLSLPSLRVNDKLLTLPQKFRTVRKSGLTFAPEAGSERLRAVINKEVSDENLFSACKLAFELGWRHIKLYFMIGLPTETDDDIIAMAKLSNHAATLCKKRGRDAPITCSVSNFIPKPVTPFQWAKMASAAELLRKQQLIAQNINRKLVDYKSHDVNISILEGALARGDQRLGAVILHAWENGARLDNWSEHFRQAIWDNAFAACGLTKEQFCANELADNFAWANIDCGVSTDFLRREYEKALQEIKTAPCSNEHCANCGVAECVR